MRVIAGIAKGRILHGPKSDRIRPALDKVKGAIFNILYDVRGQKVLDLFAGTGSVGIEALSRGAESCVFVDSSPEALKIIRENLKRTGFEKQAQVVKLELPAGLRQLKTSFDLIFVDPPYDRNLVNPTLKVVVEENQLAPDGIVIVEHSPREVISPDVGLTLSDQRRYGQTFISFLTQQQRTGGGP